MATALRNAVVMENRPESGAVCLAEAEFIWMGAEGGSAWKYRPLRLAYEKRCIFRPIAQKALDEAGIPWEMAVESDSAMTVEASLSADMAVHACLRGTMRNLCEIDHKGTLPEMPGMRINMMVASHATAPLAQELAEMVRAAYHLDRPPVNIAKSLGVLSRGCA